MELIVINVLVLTIYKMMALLIIHIVYLLAQVICIKTVQLHLISAIFVVILLINALFVITQLIAHSVLLGILIFYY